MHPDDQEKKYADKSEYPIIGCMYCKDKNASIMLRNKTLELIMEDGHLVLIRFSTGAAHWYKRSRFIEILDNKGNRLTDSQYINRLLRNPSLEATKLYLK